MHKIFILFCMVLFVTRGQDVNSESEEKGTTEVTTSLDSQEETENDETGKSFLSSGSIGLGSDEYDYPYSRKQFHIYYRRRRYKEFDALQYSSSIGRRLKSV